MPDLDAHGEKDPDRQPASIAPLTAVKRDILWILHNSEAATRSEVREAVSEYRAHNYSRPHIHRTTEELEEGGLVEIDAQAGVGSMIALTERGRRALQRRRAWTAGTPEAEA